MSCDANHSPCCNANGSGGCNVNCNTSCKVGCNVKGEVSCNRSCNRSRHTDSGINGAAPPPIAPPPAAMGGSWRGGGGGRCWGSGPEHGGGQRGTAWHFWYRCHWPPAARARGLRVPLISPPPPRHILPPPTPPIVIPTGKKRDEKRKRTKKPNGCLQGKRPSAPRTERGPPPPPPGVHSRDTHSHRTRPLPGGGYWGGLSFFLLFYGFFFSPLFVLFLF